jgi:AmmeMemoRadiSam system protein B
LVVRFPAHAGTFYAGSSNKLREQVDYCFKHELGPGRTPTVSQKNCNNVISLICPHAGFIYSGPIAAHAYDKLAEDGKPNTVVIIGPNHTGYGSGVSIATSSVWRTPLGGVEIDSELVHQICANSEYVDLDDLGHRFEHSVEVQLPFLQYLYDSDFKLVPISMMMQDIEVSRDLGNAVAKAILGKNVIMIASTDLTHYQNSTNARRNDKKIIDAIIGLDENAVYNNVREYNISMCGYGPVSAVLIASKRLKASNAELLKYATSGDVTGDYNHVVGYASFSITRNTLNLN